MFDTHCHLIDPQFTNDLDLVLERARAARVTKIINAGYDLKTSLEAIAMARKYQELLPAVGIHPNDAAAESLNDMQKIEELIVREKVSAIGETGLDYYRNTVTKNSQKQLFKSHIEIARRYHLPLLIHTRNSVDEAIEVLKEEKYYCGVFHCYSGTYEQAKVILDMGFYLGFGGILTFSKKTREVFKKIPIDTVVLETDAPFLAPEGHRGRRNEPSYIVETLNTAAAVMGMKTDDLEEILEDNSNALFTNQAIS